jgi:hypothetical protein
MTTEQIQEGRLRRAARRQGLVLAKSHCRTPEAMVYGTYMIVDMHTNAAVASDPGGYGLSLDDVAEALGVEA